MGKAIASFIATVIIFAGCGIAFYFQAQINGFFDLASPYIFGIVVFALLWAIVALAMDGM